jgi:hypothetical protein
MTSNFTSDNKSSDEAAPAAGDAKLATAAQKRELDFLSLSTGRLAEEWLEMTGAIRDGGIGTSRNDDRQAALLHVAGRTIADLQHLRARAMTSFAVEQGERWRQEKASELEALPVGTVVMINVVSGAYVTATTHIEAMDKFDQTFGKGVTIDYTFEVGRSTFIGGGLG